MYLFEKCMERAFKCNLSWGLTQRYVKMPGRTKKTFWFQRADLAVLLVACAGNQQWSGGYFCNISSLQQHMLGGKKMQFFVPNPLVQVSPSNSMIC